MSLFSDARGIVSATTRHSDLALVGLLVAVIALMIMPLPTALVDTLIGANLALSFAIMMMTMYVRTPLEFSSFPTMLLFTTLFRVGRSSRPSGNSPWAATSWWARWSF